MRASVEVPRPVTALMTALALAGCLLVGLVTAPSAQASDAGSFVSNINASRRAAGLHSLSTSSSLAAVARSWASSMASSGRLAHNPRITSQVSGWRVLGENVGVGGDPASLHRAFMASAPHRANILSSRYTQVGIGVASGGGRLWVVEVFRLPTGASASRTTTKTTTKAQAKASTSRRTSTHRSPAKTSKPAPKATTRKATTRPKATARSQTRSQTRSVPASRPVAVPAVQRAPLSLGAVLGHVGEAFTGSPDALDAWQWLLNRLLGLRTPLSA
jgi:hypothetical protein